MLAGAAAPCSCRSRSRSRSPCCSPSSRSRYRQVCYAFPGGGGAYAVARQELAPILGLVAAAALLIDYVMTVAVSTSSAMDQLISICPGPRRGGGSRSRSSVIALITVGNLRGLRESGNIFAVPTYLFVGLALLIIAIGVVAHRRRGTVVPMPRQPEAVPLGVETLTLVLLLRAFASGSVALTGVEAIANGVPAFKPPESRNAANTLVAMAVLLGVIFIGVTLVARAYDIVPSVALSGGPTVIALVAQTAFGSDSPPYYLFQIATALILFLAANTSFNAFPRLAAILAEDGYFPRQFSFRGDRLAYSWGIILLAAHRGRPVRRLLGQHDQPDPAVLGRRVRVLHAVAGRAWSATGCGPASPGWLWRMAINAFGALLTLVVLAHRRHREVQRRRVRGGDPDPRPGRDDAVHPAPVR